MSKMFKRQPPKTLTREAMALEVANINEEARTVTLSFASEQPVSRWFGAEVLQIDADAMNLARIESGLGVLLFNHKRDYVLGKILRVWIDEATHKAHAEVQFDTDEASELIWEKVRTGTLKGVSVGYAVDSWEEVAAGKTSSNGRVVGPAYVALRWQPLEISIVSVPADDSVGVGRQMEEATRENMQEAENMGFENENTQARGTGQPPVAPPAKSVSEVEAERQRCAGIINLCRDFHIDPSVYISEVRSLAEVQADVLRQLKQNNQPTGTTRAEVGEEERTKFSRAATDAILLRGGSTLQNVAEGAIELRSMRLRDLMIECVEREGHAKARYMDDQDLIRTALTGAGAFAGILSNAANKSMSNGYAAAATTFEAWVGKGSNPDFKEAVQYKISEAGNLEKMTENGEFKSDTVTEEGAKKSVATFGKKFSLTRKAIINDDLGALTRIPARYAAAARRGINSLVYKTLAGNSIYTSEKGNLAATAGAPTVETLSAARLAMRTMKNIKGKEILNISPQFFIGPAALQTSAEQLLRSLADPNGAHSGVINPFSNGLTIVTDAELDQYSSTSWYLAAQAGLVDTIEVTYLNGAETPVLESQVSFDVLGMEWRIYIDYGVNLLDYRGLYKNPGQ